MTLANVQFIERSLLVKKTFFILLVILIITIVGFLVRIYRITEIPSGFFADEASIGYNAYTILKTGRDEAGNYLPILFESFGGSFFRPGIPIYLSVPFVWVFGLNEFSLRLASSIIGTLTIPVIYFLAKSLFKSNKVGFLSAFFLAIAPWHIHFSRTGQEFSYFVFFLITSICMFVLGAKNRNPLLLNLSFLFFGITLYTYVVAYFLSLLFLIVLVLLYKKAIVTMRGHIMVGAIIFIIVSLPLIQGIWSGKTMSRYSQLSTSFSNKRPNRIIQGVVMTYRDHFMPEFLFLKGDFGYHSHFITRFSVHGMGQLYLFQLPLIVAGFLAIRNSRKSFLLLLGWLAFYPLGSTLVPLADGGGPFAMRSVIGVIPFQILSSLGVIALFSLIKKPVGKIVFMLILVTIIGLSFKNYLYRYFYEYPLYSSDFWGWQYGPREIINYYLDNESKYDELVMMPEFNAPSIFFKFYAPEQCDKCKLGTPDMSFNPNKNQLFVVTQAYLSNNPSIDFKTVKTINYPNGLVAFRIGEVVQ